MDLSILNKIPPLKDVDFTDDTVKKKALIVVIGVVIMIGLIVYVLIPDTNESKAQLQQRQTEVVASSIDIQEGEDNDKLGGRSNQSIFRSKEGQSLAEKLFAPQDTVFSDNPLGNIGDTIEPITPNENASSNSDAIRPGQKDVYPEGGPSFKNITKEELLQKIDGSDNSGEEDIEQQKKDLRRRENELRDRQRLIAMGVNPDTGLPFDNAGQGTSQGYDSTPQPQAQPEPQSQPQQQAVDPEIITDEESLVDDDDSFGLGTTRINSMSSAKKKDLDKLTIKAMFIEEKKVKSGDRIQLRLCEDKGITVEGVHIPKNSLLYANVQLGDRLLIHVQSVNVNGKILPLNLDAYDVDGIKGIYCPTNETEQAIKDARREAKNVATGVIGGMMRTFGARFVSTGTSVTDRLTGETSVFITPGYSFVLMKSQQ